MKDIQSNIQLDYQGLEAGIDSIQIEGESTLDKEAVRDRIRDAGYGIKKIRARQPAKMSFLACDASILKRELLYNSIWAGHVITVYGGYDGEEHPDHLSGRGSVNYGGLRYGSRIRYGAFKPYSGLEDRLDSLRTAMEIQALMEGVDADVLLFDGSIYSSLEKSGKRSGYPEHAEARKMLETLLDECCVAQVEDTHASRISRRLGYATTDLLLAEIALEANEYIMYGDELRVVHLKLPGKKTFFLDKPSTPQVVRWEFTEKSLKLLPDLAGIWLGEDDLIHPQLYPIRVADHLTRKIRVSGILDKIVRQRNLKPRHRSRRSVDFIEDIY